MVMPCLLIKKEYQENIIKMIKRWHGLFLMVMMFSGQLLADDEQSKTKLHKSSNIALHNPSHILKKPKSHILTTATLKPNSQNSVNTVSTSRQIRQYFSTERQKIKVYRAKPSLSADTEQGAVQMLKGRLAKLDSNLSALSLRKKVDSLWLKLRKANQSLLDMSTEDGAFLFEKIKTDQLSRHHVWYQQAYEGIPLWGKHVTLHVNSQDEVYMFQANYMPDKSWQTTVPQLDLQEALKIARQAVNLPDAKIKQVALNYYDDNQSLKLSYKIDLSYGLHERWLVFVDAENGKVLHRLNNIHQAGQIVEASGKNLKNEIVSFKAWDENGRYYLIDPSTPQADASYAPIERGPNAYGDTFIYDAGEGDGSSVEYISSSDLNSNWDRAAVSAMQNTNIVYNYYLQTFARKSLDNQNKNLLSAVHFEKVYNNAFWNGSFIVYGDGDGQLFSSLANCLDVAAHEMTHGVIENTANLIYQNQSGALNESFADVFAVFVDASNWTIGEDCTIASPGYLRNLANPNDGLSGQPAKMSDYRYLPNTENGDNGGVHVNSGIPNRAAYLLAEGLSAEGLGTSVGMAKAEQIYYRALNYYINASSRFIDVRRALIQSAEDLYGEAEKIAVEQAWDEVEVFDNGEDTPVSYVPTSIEAVVGKDLMVYLFPSSQGLSLYAQIFDDTFTEYDPEKDIGPLNVDANNNFIGARPTRPAVFTDDIGTVFFFIDENDNLFAKDGLEGGLTQLTNTNDIASVAVAPDARYVAYTKPFIEQIIHVIDIENDEEFAYSIEATSYQQESDNSNNTLLYADALSFDFSGTRIVFDALNCISTPESRCTDIDGGYRYWSVGVLDLITGDVSYPMANQNPTIDLGYPVFATNNSNLITMDYSVFDKTAIDIPFSSKAILFNIETQDQITLADFGKQEEPFLSLPSFWGDDKHMTIVFPDDRLVNGQPVYTSAQRVEIDENFQVVNGSQLRLNDLPAYFPVMHRAAERILAKSLAFNATSLDYGKVALGESKTLPVTVTNSSDKPVEINSISIGDTQVQSSVFTKNVQPAETFSFDLIYTPSANAALNTTAVIITNDVTREYKIKLVGNVSDAAVSAKTSKHNYFGCSSGANTKPDFILFLLLIVSMFYLQKRSLLGSKS